MDKGDFFYAEISQKDKAREILNKVLKDTEDISTELGKAIILIEIDIKYIELGLTVEEKERKIIHEIVRNP